jgi:drug/metabolite transporter (DMT)-like permease
MPVFTAFFAAIFLDEEITLTTIVCGAAIVFGLWLVNQSRSHPAPAARRASARAGGESAATAEATPEAR